MSHSFTLKKSYNSNELTKYNSLEDFMTRTKRDYRAGQGESYKYVHFYDLAKTFYSNENLNSCPYMFLCTDFYSLGGNTTTVNGLKKNAYLFGRAVKSLRPFLKSIPDNLKPLLFTTQISVGIDQISSTEYNVFVNVRFLPTTSLTATKLEIGTFEDTKHFNFTIDTLTETNEDLRTNYQAERVLTDLKAYLLRMKVYSDNALAAGRMFSLYLHNNSPIVSVFLNLWNLNQVRVSKYKTAAEEDEEISYEKGIRQIVENNSKGVTGLFNTKMRYFLDINSEFNYQTFFNYTINNYIDRSDVIWQDNLTKITFPKKLWWYTALTQTGQRNLIRELYEQTEDVRQNIMNITYWSSNEYFETNVTVFLKKGSVREELHKVFNYSANVLDHIPYVKNKRDREYGIELECSTNLPVQTLIDKQEELFFFVKSDSSVTGSKRYKVELVTTPLSLKDQKKHWSAFFEKVDYQEFDISKKTNNGMHIHIGTNHFADIEQQKRFCWFFQCIENRLGVYTISERNDLNGFFGYSKPIEFPSDRSYTHCYKNVLQYTRNNRGIINIKNNTIEVRLFRGIVSLGEIIKNLEFTDAVFEFTAPEKSHRHLTFDHFFKWLANTPKNKYLTLKYYLEELKTDFISEGVKYGKIIRNAGSESKVRENFTTAGVEVNSDNIDSINSVLELCHYSSRVRLTTIPKGKNVGNLDHSLFKDRDKDLAKRFYRTARVI